ncbi:MAG: twin-arginine translocase subunit TatC [Planctomycetota bacterium]|nr:twin-arginine translocase subunit TatC [Planctomycetota bacterium]
MARPSDDDLFSEEETMVAMSFGDHLEELRIRLVLALMGLAIGVVLTFIPPVNLGRNVLRQLSEPAQVALDKFYKQKAEVRSSEAAAEKKFTDPTTNKFPADDFVRELMKIAPELNLPKPESLKGKEITLPISQAKADVIKTVAETTEQRSALINTAPLEPMMIFFMVCLVTGLVLSSPWVFYHIWAFVAAGLYRHERAYVQKYLPFSVILFLSGVLLCFYVILPVTLSILLEFNVWLGIEPMLKLNEWISFATILPLVFGICFQTPLVMLFVARLGILNVEDFRSKRKIALLMMVVIAAVLTPGPDVFSQLMLAVPMYGLYELGILMVQSNTKPDSALSGA